MKVLMVVKCGERCAVVSDVLVVKTVQWCVLC